MIGRSARIPAKKFRAHSCVHWSIGEFCADWIDEPSAATRGAIAHRRIAGEPEAILSGGHSGGIVWRAADGHSGTGATPFLIGEARFVQANRVIEIGKKTARIRNEIDCRALMRNDSAAVNVEFVLLGFAAKDWMVFKDQALGAGPRLAKEKGGGGEAADSAANYYAVIEFASVAGIVQKDRRIRIAQLVACGENFPGIAVAFCVFPDAAVAVPVLYGSRK